jgi:hypothetical protein
MEPMTCRARLYGTLDNDLAVFLLEHLCKCWYGRFTIKRLLVIGTVGIREEGALVIHKEVARLCEIVESKLLVDERQR